MTCEITAKEDQTEFEFFQQMYSTYNTPVCCGPIVQIGFTGESLSQITHALDKADVALDVLDRHSREVLDSSHLNYSLCTKHWIAITLKITQSATETHNDLWAQLSFYIFRVLCLTNDWDHKELINYLNTLLV